MKSICLVLIAVAVLSLPAVAGNPVLGKAVIPFTFTVNGQTLQPGTYELICIGQGLYRIQNVHTDTGTMINTNSSISQSEGMTLIFRAYGDAHFLGEIRDTALQFSATFPISKAERRVKEENTEITLVALALKH